MMNFKKLDKTVEEVKTGLEERFPSITFDLAPYYCGMGYVGIRIVIDPKDQIDNVTKYYDQHYATKFFRRTVVHRDENKSNEDEIGIVSGNEVHEALSIFRSYNH